MTYTQSKELFDETIKNYVLEIVGKDKISFKINGEDIDLAVVYSFLHFTLSLYLFYDHYIIKIN